MSDPIDEDGVRRVLGTMNYLSKFLPNLANVVEPLRKLTHNVNSGVIYAKLKLVKWSNFKLIVVLH